MSTGLTFNGTDLIIGANGFSTQNRYVREVASPSAAVMAMVEGASIEINTSGDYCSWRYECGSLTVLGITQYTVFVSGHVTWVVVPAPAAGFATDRLIAL